MRKASVTESIFISSQTQVISRSTVSGSLDISSFYTGLRYLESKYEALRCCILKQDNDFFFVHKPENATTKMIILDPADIAVDAVYRRLLGIKLDLAAELYRLYILQHGNLCEIFMLTSHAITDAQSLITLHGDLVCFLEQISLGILPQINLQPFAEDIDAIIARYLKSFDSTSVACFGNKEAPAVGLLHLRADNALSSEVGHEFTQLLIEPLLLKHVLDCCHKKNISVHSLLTAVFAHAFRQIREEDSVDEHIIIRSSADLRRRIKPAVATNLIQTAATAYTILLNTNNTLWDIANHVSDYIYQANRCNAIVYGHLEYCQNFAAVAIKQNYAINLSNIGSVPKPKTNKLSMLGFEYALGWNKAAPSVSISTFANRMIINLTFLPRFISRNDVRQLLILVLNNLKAATIDNDIS